MSSYLPSTKPPHLTGWRRIFSPPAYQKALSPKTSSPWRFSAHGREKNSFSSPAKQLQSHFQLHDDDGPSSRQSFAKTNHHPSNPTPPNRQDAFDVHSRSRWQAHLHAEEGRVRRGHQVGAPGALLPRRQVVAPARHPQEALWSSGSHPGWYVETIVLPPASTHLSEEGRENDPDQNSDRSLTCAYIILQSLDPSPPLSNRLSKSKSARD